MLCLCLVVMSLQVDNRVESMGTHPDSFLSFPGCQANQLSVPIGNAEIDD